MAITTNIGDNTLIECVREIFSSLKDKSLGMEAQFDVQYPTGFHSLDYVLGQRIAVKDPERGLDYTYDSVGLVDGSYNLFIGRSGCGKSTLVKQISANIIRNFPNGGIYEDSIEGGITMTRNEYLLGMTPDEVKRKMSIRNSNITIESCYRRLKIIYDFKMEHADKLTYDTGLLDSHGEKIFKFEPTVYIIDSLALLMPEKLTQEEEISGQMSTTATAKLLASFFRRIIPIIKSVNIILNIINHVNHDVNINPYQRTTSQNIYLDPGETCPGGNTPFYLANNVFRLYDNNKLTEDKELGICGNFVTIKIIKSRTSRSGVSFDLVFNQDTGFDPILSLYIMLKKANMIKGAGAFLYLDGYPEYKFAQRNLKKLLETNEDMARAFADMCFDILHNSIKTPELIFDVGEEIIEDGIVDVVDEETTKKINPLDFINNRIVNGYNNNSD